MNILGPLSKLYTNSLPTRYKNMNDESMYDPANPSWMSYMITAWPNHFSKRCTYVPDPAFLALPSTQLPTFCTRKERLQSLTFISLTEACGDSHPMARHKKYVKCLAHSETLIRQEQRTLTLTSALS